MKESHTEIAGQPVYEAIVDGVYAGSIADEAGIEPGDVILTINGQPMEDLIDYQFLISDPEIQVLVRKANGEEWLIDIEKDIDESLGIDFKAAVFDEVRHCANRCPFCFIDQMPMGMRSSLYVFDDDYRLSFLEGHFVTLTNLRKREWERLIRLKLSPLYVSVHTTDPDLREYMIGTPKARTIMGDLHRLVDNGITVHAQIVLCPGMNDGDSLERTIDDLATLHPGVDSVTVVPVGLTQFREHLADIGAWTPTMMRNFIKCAQKKQALLLDKLGTRFIWPGDEFHLGSGLPLPTMDQYEYMPQTENGIGLARTFIDAFAASFPQDPKPVRPRAVTIATGKSGGKILREPVAKLNTVNGMSVNLVAVPNQFFGETISCAGLVTGRDLARALKGRELGEEVIIPEVMVRQRANGPIFLDDVTLEAVEQRLETPITVLGGAGDLVSYLVI